MQQARPGIIRDCDGDSVLVELAVDAACGSCASRAGCGSQGVRSVRLPVAAAGSLVGGRPLTAGTRVVLDSELPPHRAALVAYLLPVIALLAGAIAGQLALAAAAEAAARPLLADLGAAAGALLGLVAALLELRRRDRAPRITVAPGDSGT